MRKMDGCGVEQKIDHCFVVEKGENFRKGQGGWAWVCGRGLAFERLDFFKRWKMAAHFGMNARMGESDTYFPIRQNLSICRTSVV